MKKVKTNSHPQDKQPQKEGAIFAPGLNNKKPGRPRGLNTFRKSISINILFEGLDIDSKLINDLLFKHFRP